jgi:hypothetical protein
MCTRYLMLLKSSFASTLTCIQMHLMHLSAHHLMMVLM